MPGRLPRRRVTMATKKDIMAMLDEANIEYDSKSRKDVLEALLPVKPTTKVDKSEKDRLAAAGKVVDGLCKPMLLLKEFEIAMNAEPMNKRNQPMAQMLQMYKVQKPAIKEFCDRLSTRARAKV